MTAMLEDGLRNVADNHGLLVAAIGMAIVILALGIIALFIAVLPRLLAATDRLISRVRAVRQPRDDAARVAAIAVALHQDRQRGR